MPEALISNGLSHYEIQIIRSTRSPQEFTIFKGTHRPHFTQFHAIKSNRPWNGTQIFVSKVDWATHKPACADQIIFTTKILLFFFLEKKLSCDL